MRITIHETLACTAYEQRTYIVSGMTRAEFDAAVADEFATDAPTNDNIVEYLRDRFVPVEREGDVIDVRERHVNSVTFTDDPADPADFVLPETLTVEVSVGFDTAGLIAEMTDRGMTLTRDAIIAYAAGRADDDLAENARFVLNTVTVPPEILGTINVVTDYAGVIPSVLHQGPLR